MWVIHAMGGDRAHGSRGCQSRRVCRGSAPPSWVSSSCSSAHAEAAQCVCVWGTGQGAASQEPLNPSCVLTGGWDTLLHNGPLCRCATSVSSCALSRYHQYKFIVDGKWRHDETAPFMPDPLGNVNNWLFVRRLDPGLRCGQSAGTLHPSSLADAPHARHTKALHSRTHTAMQAHTPRTAHTCMRFLTSSGPFDQQLHQEQQQQQQALAAQQHQQQHQQLLSQAQLEAAAAAAAATSAGGHQASALTAALDLSPPSDVDMASAEAAVVPPIVIHNPKEPVSAAGAVSCCSFSFTHESVSNGPLPPITAHHHSQP